MSSEGGSFGFIGVHVGESWRVWCDSYAATTPILTIGAGQVTVHISIARREEIPAEAVEFARELAQQAERFAVDCERLNAAHEVKAADGNAA